MGNHCSSCAEESKEIIHQVQEKGISEVAKEKYEEVKEEVKEMVETVKEKVAGASAEVAAGVEAATGCAVAPAKELNVTFQAATGKETEIVFKTKPLPFTCKPQAKGGCCASGTTGKFVIAKIEAAKAKEYYDLKPGMIIKKIDGAELVADQDFQEFQKALADKVNELPAVTKEAPAGPKEEPKKEEAKPEAPAAEAPKEEAGKAEAPKEEAPTQECK
eukprot:gb/GFBE01053524.1/.p1 GENE.gb/GFBE01053524.1/~~gb/GFBE01053524.1/.p1  ORF type:complete len:218 (+),score=99.74 gb/GFBE01053524.1/:1-654(+)